MLCYVMLVSRLYYAVFSTFVFSYSSTEIIEIGEDFTELSSNVDCHVSTDHSQNVATLVLPTCTQLYRDNETHIRPSNSVSRINISVKFLSIHTNPRHFTYTHCKISVAINVSNILMPCQNYNHYSKLQLWSAICKWHLVLFRAVKEQSKDEFRRQCKH